MEHAQAAHFDPNAVIDTDFVLLSAEASLADAMSALLRRPGRLGVVQDSRQSIIGCLDAFILAQMFQAGQRTDVRLQKVALLKPAFVTLSVSLESLLGLYSEDSHRPVLVGATTSALLGHIPPQRLLQWMAHRQQDLLQQIEELRSDLERRDEYLAIVSHDLRSPLSVIQLATDYLQLDEQDQAMSDSARSFVERIRRNSSHALNLVKSLLDTVRAVGGLQLQYDQIVLSTLIDDLVQSLSLVAGKKQQKILVKHLDEIKIYLDSERISQVFENVMMNAIKYAPQGASIQVRTQLEEREGHTYGAIQVINPGKRISLEEGQRLLQPFVQGGPGREAKDGIGLGLSIVKKIVELHDGFLEFGGDKEDEVSFKVYLPNATSVMSQHRGQGPRTGRLVLVVDDDEGIRDFTQAVLTTAGFEVLTAEDGARAFSLFQRHKPNLIISDVRMDKVDGFELLAKIREISPTTPFVLCSGYYLGLEKDLQHFHLKPDLFIDKPFKMSEFVQQIAALLGDAAQEAS